MIRDQPLLPDAIRYAADAAAELGATVERLDPDAYLVRIVLGERATVLGAGGVCSFPVNGATAFTLSRDKAHTNSALAAAGLPVIPGRLFFAHRRRVGLRGAGREAEDAVAYVRAQGFPVFCKPNTGSRGHLAEIVESESALTDYIRRVAAEFEAFLVQPVLNGAEHRVLVQDGSVVFHAAKSEPCLIGDGVSTLAQLAAAANTQLEAEGLSAWPASAFAQAGAPEHVPPAEARNILRGRRNLSAEGDIAGFSEMAPEPLARLALSAVAAIGLRIGAVDIFDLSPARDLSDLVVIEVNGNPGLRTLELAGRPDIIRRIWTGMLREMLET